MPPPIKNPIVLFKNLIILDPNISPTNIIDNQTKLFNELLRQKIIDANYNVMPFVKCDDEKLSNDEVIKVTQALFKDHYYLSLGNDTDARKHKIWDMVHSTDTKYDDLAILKRFGYSTYTCPHYNNINEEVKAHLFNILLSNNILDEAFIPKKPDEIK